MPDSSPESLSYQATRALARTAGLTRKGADRFFRQFDLSQSQFNVLFLLDQGDANGCSQTEIADQLLVKGANTSVLLRKLEASGLVTRDADPADERAHRVHITSAGRRLLRRIKPRYYTMMEQATSGLSKAELENFIRLLERCQANIRDLEGQWA